MTEPKQTVEEKKAEAAAHAAAEKSAKDTAKTAKPGVFRLDQGESLP